MFNLTLVDLLYPQTDKSISFVNNKAYPLTINISPNPASDLLTIKFNQVVNGPINVMIIESTGRIVFSETRITDAGGHSILLNTNEIPGGFYLLCIQPEGEQSVTKRIIIAR